MLPPVVGAAWLQDHRDDVVVADVRWYLDGRSGRDAYARGHLPGAVFVDLDAVLAGPATREGGRHPLPCPEAFARGMAELGIGDGDTVVAYDDDGGVMAARLVWMLRATGRDAALLDGGIAVWDGPLETDTPPRQPATFAPVAWPADRIATADDAADRAHVVIDARTRERYLGLDDPVDPRWGHVPGARSLPCRENLAPDGRFLAAGDLRARFEALGARRARRWSPTADRASRPATTCSRWSAPGWGTGGCSPGRGRSGAPTSAARSRPATTDAGQAADRPGAGDANNATPAPMAGHVAVCQRGHGRLRRRAIRRRGHRERARAGRSVGVALRDRGCRVGRSVVDGDHLDELAPASGSSTAT